MTNKEKKRRSYYEDCYSEMLLAGKITGTILDPFCVLREKKHSPGIYSWYVYDLTDNTKCTAYVGETADLYERCLEHLKRWFYNDQTLHFLGICPNELKRQYALVLEAQTCPVGIAYSTPERREEMEKAVIAQKKPYTQYTLDPLQKMDPSRFDSCIWHKYRRDAFLRAINS